MNWSERLKSGSSLFDVRLFELGGTQVTAATLVTFIAVILATLLFARAAQRLVSRGFALRGQGDEGAAAVSSRLARYAVLVIGFSVGVHSLGIDLTALFAAGAVFAVAIGFAMQNIVQNFVSGVILLLERAIKPGDILEVEGRMVRVKDMGIRATVARTLDEEDLIVPNSILVSSTVKNYTLRDSLFRLRSTVGVSYGSDMSRVSDVLGQAASELAWASSDRRPRVLLLDFGDSAVVFEVSVWLDDPWSLNQRRSDLNRKVWEALAAAGVTIAFPQVDVHFDAPVSEALATAGTRGAAS